MVFQHRLKDLDSYDHVKIYVYELKKLGVNKGEVLHSLKSRGEISYDKKGFFKALRPGPINPELLESTKKKPSSVILSPTHIWMREQLLGVSSNSDELSVYFTEFLKLRGSLLKSFFTVDDFSGRVHTPVVSLKHSLRSSLKLFGESLVSIDVKQMQPTILAKVLRDSIGDNEFSKSIFDGKDVYVLLQESSGLKTRDEAKKMLFRLIFSKPSKDVEVFNGDTTWVDWINDYKSKVEPKNPHKNKVHSNLAWLLQYSEVQVMTCIWDRLAALRIPFLSIHDDVLCRKRDHKLVYSIMDEELKKHFDSFKLTVTNL